MARLETGRAGKWEKTMKQYDSNIDNTGCFC
jgi:hypothetical protein